MKYLLGGLVIESEKEHIKWRSYQCRDSYKPHIKMIYTPKIKINGMTALATIDGIDIWKSTKQYALSYDGKILMHIDFSLNVVILDILEELSDQATEEIIIKKVLPLTFYQRNLAIPLHSTLVMKDQKTAAFVGASYSGKSTLAAYLATYKNFQVVCDDILPIYTNKDSIYTYSMVTELRLREDSASYFEALNISHSKTLSPITLKNIFVISEADNISCNKVVRTSEIFLKNLFASYLSDFSSPFINRILLTAPMVSAYSLSYPKKFDLLENVSTNIIDILNA